MSLSATTANLERLDFYVNGRPTHTVDVTDGEEQVVVPTPDGLSSLEVKGYHDGELRAGRKLRFG